MSKTVLDIPKKNNSLSLEETYEVNSIQSIFEAIEHGLKINPNIETIKIKDKENKINVQDLMFKHGLGLGMDYSKDGEIRFRGYSRWVYFLEDKPVHFDQAACMTDTPSHETGWNTEFYNSLQFDSFKKISF